MPPSELPTLATKSTRCILLSGAAAVLLPVLVQAEEVGAECRGVAAGVVAAMRASGELQGEGAVEAAVIAARRACSAAREGLGPASTVAAADAGKAESDAEEDDDDLSLWDLLTRDRELKPGNERLRRLKQQ